MIIQHNISSINLMQQMGCSTSNIKKSMERLSSGYRINRAADDAATLSISEKKRAQIRGLLRAAKNAEEGISYVRTADGAMSQTGDILNRMRELTVQALNDAVYMEEDLAAMQMEFNELQSEIDTINDQTDFNKKHIFEHCPGNYFSFDGNRHWPQDQTHVIDGNNNSLTLVYTMEENGAEKTMTLQIPEGEYTTQELMDEMDDVITSMGDGADGMYLEYTDEGTCNMVLRGGYEIGDLTGGLSYLFFDTFSGSQIGSLLGTTVFSPGAPLTISDRNNELEFTIAGFDGTERDVSIQIPNGYYSRQQIIDALNQELMGTGVSADEYGPYSIQLGGEEGYVTGLKGNMFEIDNGPDVMNSIFYDNTKYGSVVTTLGVFKGGAVLVNNSQDSEYNHFSITDRNNVLKIQADQASPDSYVEIVLDQGDYTMGQMVTQLQQKLDDANVGIKVDSHIKTITTGNGNQLSFEGLRLTTKTEGKESNISFDIAGSSAYDTLFVKGTYTDKGSKVRTSDGSYTYQKPYVMGGRTFEASDFPLTIGSDNHAFQIQLSEKMITSTATTTTSEKYIIELTQKTYSSLSDILAELNDKLTGAGASAGLKGKIKAVEEQGRISFVPADDNRTVTGISFANTTQAAYKGAYEELFVGENVVTSTTPISGSGTNPSVNLGKVTFPKTFDETNNKLNVKVNGAGRPVTITPGTYNTKEDLLDEINRQLKGTTTSTPNSFSGSGTGSTTDKNRDYSAQGKIIRTPVNGSVQGTGKLLEGSTQVVNGAPAKYTVPIVLENSTVIGADNNQLKITVNNHPYNITITDGTYTPAQLQQEIQKQLENAISTEWDKVDVSLNSSNQLVFATEKEGELYTLQLSSANSSFLDKLGTKKTAATVDVVTPLKESITIDGSSNTFTGTLNNQNYTVTLSEGMYTRSGFIDELNRQFTASGLGIKAALKGTGFSLTTTEANGTSSKLTYHTSSGGTSAAALYGDLITTKPAVATLNRPLKENVEIADGNNVFTTRLTKNGIVSDLSITIPEGQYGRQELAAKMDELYGDKISVSVDGAGYLTFATKDEGQNVSLRIDNSVSGNAGTSLFGETQVTTPDIVADINGMGELVLTGSGGSSYTLSVIPSNESDLCPPQVSVQNVNPTIHSGTINANYYRLYSQFSVPSQVTIKDYNKDFKFVYKKSDGTSVNAGIVLEEKTYTRDELQQALQEKIDAALGAGEITVTVNSSRIQFMADNYGEGYSFDNVSGGFYEFEMNRTVVREVTERTSNINGTQGVGDTYIIGRKDVRNGTSEIKKGTNDTLSLDVTIDGTVHTLEMVLDPGRYNANQLIQMLQEKLDAGVVAAGLPEHSILAGIGVFDTNVIGADDKNALDIYLNRNANLSEGNYKIDGLKGTSLFEIFYKTSGELIPAYVTGTNDISEGLLMEDGKNTFSVDVDHVTYEYTVPPGEYTAQEYIEKLNELFENPDNGGKVAPITASLSGKSIKISHQKLGKHTVDNVQGPAKTEMFYENSSRYDYEEDLYLQVGANAKQGIALPKFSVSTMSMGINSITISRHKYANKALGRIDEALSYLNEHRSLYGAKENRLEHVVKGNENTAENLQASESIDRDTNMAEEMMKRSKEQILQQAQSAMMAQINDSAQSVLSLLNNG